MKKETKVQVIESISELLKEYPNYYVTDIAGLNAKNTVKLRRACFLNKGSNSLSSRTPCSTTY